MLEGRKKRFYFETKGRAETKEPAQEGCVFPFKENVKVTTLMLLTDACGGREPR